MNTETELKQIKMMLGAILAENNQIHYVGGYAHGLTEKGDHYLVLFPSSEKLKRQICRVYPDKFPRLPEFIDTKQPAGLIPSQNSPKKEKAIKCPVFCVLTNKGKETPMGRETRFYNVLYTLGNSTPANPQQSPSPAPRPGPQPTPRGNSPVRPETARPAPAAHRKSAPAGNQQPQPAPSNPPAPAPAPKSLTNFCPHCETYPVDNAGEWCEKCLAETAGNGQPAGPPEPQPAPVVLTNPHPPRPWQPDYLRLYLRTRAGELETEPLKPGQRNVIVSLIEKEIETNPKEKRHAVFEYLIGKGSLKDFTNGEAAAVFRWLHPTQDDGGDWVAAAAAVKEIMGILGEGKK